MYSFPALCCDFTSLVALPIHTTKHPEQEKDQLEKKKK